MPENGNLTGAVAEVSFTQNCVKYDFLIISDGYSAKLNWLIFDVKFVCVFAFMRHVMIATDVLDPLTEELCKQL